MKQQEVSIDFLDTTIDVKDNFTFQKKFKMIVEKCLIWLTELWSETIHFKGFKRTTTTDFRTC